VAAQARLQVSIPSLRVTIGSRVLPPEIPKIAPAYAAGIAREVERIASLIPRQELAVQWDCTEPVQFEQAGEADKRAIIDQIAGYAAWVPEGVELGYHLCYGDWEHKHFAEPKDTAAMVEMANSIAAAVSRPIDWLHLPVPRERDDEAYFTSLKNLELRPETSLFLGLVHHTDGIEGTRRRMQTASKVVREYGIATECGMGRRPTETIMELLRIQQQAADL
jgi:methionine synthase II (cobalamin-independent)